MAPQGQRNIKIVIWLSLNICTHTVMPRHVDSQALEGIACVSGREGRGVVLLHRIRAGHLFVWQYMAKSPLPKWYVDSEYKLRGSTKARISSEQTAQPREESLAPGGACCPGPDVRKPRRGTLKKGGFNGKRISDPFWRETRGREKQKH